MFLGAPADPLPRGITLTIAGAVSRWLGVIEAHLPQCYAPGVIDDPAQILVLVVRQGEAVRNLVARAGRELGNILPDGTHLDMWVIGADDKFLPIVREAGCRIA